MQKEELQKAEFAGGDESYFKLVDNFSEDVNFVFRLECYEAASHVEIQEQGNQ